MASSTVQNWPRSWRHGANRTNSDRCAHTDWSERLHGGGPLPRCSHVDHEEEFLHSFEVRTSPWADQTVAVGGLHRRCLSKCRRHTYIALHPAPPSPARSRRRTSRAVQRPPRQITNTRSDVFSRPIVRMFAGDEVFREYHNHTPDEFSTPVFWEHLLAGGGAKLLRHSLTIYSRDPTIVLESTTNPNP